MALAHHRGPHLGRAGRPAGLARRPGSPAMVASMPVGSRKAELQLNRGESRHALAWWLTTIDFQDAVDRDGRPDWLIHPSFQVENAENSKMEEMLP
jgi:hypothetical protein